MEQTLKFLIGGLTVEFTLDEIFENCNPRTFELSQFVTLIHAVTVYLKAQPELFRLKIGETLFQMFQPEVRQSPDGMIRGICLALLIKWLSATWVFEYSRGIPLKLYSDISDLIRQIVGPEHEWKSFTYENEEPITVFISALIFITKSNPDMKLPCCILKDFGAIMPNRIFVDLLCQMIFADAYLSDSDCCRMMTRSAESDEYRRSIFWRVNYLQAVDLGDYIECVKALSVKPTFPIEFRIWANMPHHTRPETLPPYLRTDNQKAVFELLPFPIAEELAQNLPLCNLKYGAVLKYGGSV
jgi:hypothetical protein